MVASQQSRPQHDSEPQPQQSQHDSEPQPQQSQQHDSFFAALQVLHCTPYEKRVDHQTILRSGDPNVAFRRRVGVNGHASTFRRESLPINCWSCHGRKFWCRGCGKGERPHELYKMQGGQCGEHCPCGACRPLSFALWVKDGSPPLTSAEVMDRYVRSDVCAHEAQLAKIPNVAIFPPGSAENVFRRERRKAQKRERRVKRQRHAIVSDA
jgi:hypothetical protein